MYELQCFTTVYFLWSAHKWNLFLKYKNVYIIYLHRENFKLFELNWTYLIDESSKRLGTGSKTSDSPLSQYKKKTCLDIHMYKIKIMWVSAVVNMSKIYSFKCFTRIVQQGHVFLWINDGIKSFFEISGLFCFEHRNCHLFYRTLLMLEKVTWFLLYISACAVVRSSMASFHIFGCHNYSSRHTARKKIHM